MKKEQISSQKEQFIKKVKLKIRCCFALFLMGIIGAAAGIYLEKLTDLSDFDWSRGFYLGTGFGLIFASIITIIKQNMLLKNPEKLEQRMLM